MQSAVADVYFSITFILKAESVGAQTTHDKENKTKVELLQNRTFRFVILHYVTNNNIDMYNLVINCV